MTLPPTPPIASHGPRLTWAERLGYGVGDFGFNLYWTTFGSFLAAFYTDVFGIAATAAGTLLFITKLVDAVADPIMGAVADRTRSRWGKFRPYILAFALPMAATAYFTFTTPKLGNADKLLWAYVSYTLMMLVYTALNIPYSALSGVMTSDSRQRVGLISTRFAFAFAGAFAVNRWTLALVSGLGGNDPERGWQLTMLLYGAIAAVTFVITFGTTRERVTQVQTEQSKPLQDLLDLGQNRPWLVLFALSMTVMVTFTLRAGSAFYYFKYHLERPDLLASYLATQSVAYAAGALVAPFLLRFMDKRQLLSVLLSLVGVLSVALCFVPKQQLALIFALNVLMSFALGPKSPLTWSMYADAADFNEHKTGRRATGLTFAAATFSQKVGGALGSACMLWCLGYLGYAANAAQSGASVGAIVALQTVIPGVFALLGAAVMRIYPLSDAHLSTMSAELAERRNVARGHSP